MLFVWWGIFYHFRIYLFIYMVTILPMPSWFHLQLNLESWLRFILSCICLLISTNQTYNETIAKTISLRLAHRLFSQLIFWCAILRWKQTRVFGQITEPCNFGGMTRTTFRKLIFYCFIYFKIDTSVTNLTLGTMNAYFYLDEKFVVKAQWFENNDIMSQDGLWSRLGCSIRPSIDFNVQLSKLGVNLLPCHPYQPPWGVSLPIVCLKKENPW